VRENDIDFQPDELGCELGEALAASLRPAIFDRDGASFDPAEFAQSLHKSGSQLALRGRRSRTQKPDSRQLARLLRARRERPRRGGAAEQRDELASFHCPVPPVLPTERIAHLGCQIGVDSSPRSLFG
jgi:hypothetical protein